MNLSIYIKNILNSFITDSDKTLGNIMLIRDSSNTRVSNESTLSQINSIYEKGFFSHSFSSESMLTPYEPFLNAIKYYYDEFFSHSMSIETFVQKCNVYKLHEIIFTSYIETGHAKRDENIILAEIAFEINKIEQSIVSTLNYIASFHKILISLNDFHYAGVSTFKLVSNLISSMEECSAKILIILDDSKLVPSYRQDAFDKVISNANERNIIFDMESYDFDEVKAYSSYSPSSSQMSDYNTNLQNLFYFLNYEDMEYYIDIIHSRIIEEHFAINNKDSFEFYEYGALCFLNLYNENRAIFMCERLPLYYDEETDLVSDFTYSYVYCLIQTSLQHSEQALVHAQRCVDIAAKLDDQERSFIAKVLLCSVQFGGWRNVFSVNFLTVECNEEFINELREHKYYNTLAYCLVYGFDNEEEDLRVIASGELTQTYREAFDLINKIGNTSLLLSAYTKYIVMLNTSGFHNEVNRFYDAKLAVLQHDKNERRMANLYMGRGYTSIMNENYDAANDQLIAAIKILHKLKDPEAIAEALYNMVLNCLCAEDYKTAKNLMSTIFKILSNLDLKSIQISSPAKLYTLDAICHYKTGSEYGCFLNYNKIKKLVDLRIGNNHDPAYIRRNPHEDLFIYYLISSVLDKESGMVEQALKEFELAFDLFKTVSNYAFYSVTFFFCEYYDLLSKMNMTEEADALLNFAKEHCTKNNFMKKYNSIERFAQGRQVHNADFSNSISQSEIHDIIALSYSVGKEKQLINNKKNIWFLSSWQEILNHDNFTQKELLSNALNTFQDNFNFENMLYVEVNKNTPDVLYKNFESCDDAAAAITQYFKHHNKEFIANCTDKDFFKYEPFLKMINNSNTFTIIGIPVYNEDKLVAFFLGTINNQNEDISLLSSDDLAIMRTAIIQLHYGIERIKSRFDIINMNEKLKTLAVTDLLTGIYNRQGMSKIMDMHTNPDSIVSILYIDLDNFKFYNDNFGHDTGDMILKNFAHMLHNIVSNSGHVIRYGGDEFLALLYDADLDIATSIAKSIYSNISSELIPKIRSYIGNEAVIPNDKLLSCSIGITKSNSPSKCDIYSSLKMADNALYYMKKNAKGNYYVLDDSNNE